jgi:hypothetical protein
MTDLETQINEKDFFENNSLDLILVGSVKRHITKLENISNPFFDLESQVDELLSIGLDEVEKSKTSILNTKLDFDEKFIGLLGSEVSNLKHLFVRGNFDCNIYDDLLKHRSVLSKLNQVIYKYEAEAELDITSRKQFSNFLKTIYSDYNFISKITDLVSKNLSIEDIQILKEIYILSIKEIYKFYNLSEEQEVCYFYGKQSVTHVCDLCNKLVNKLIPEFPQCEEIKDNLLQFIFRQKQLSSENGFVSIHNKKRRLKELVRN